MDVIDQPLALRLKAATQATHEVLDRSIMNAAAFETLPGYRRFLRVQWAFHRDIDALYLDPALQARFPDLAERRRLPLIEADLADLDEPRSPAPPPLMEPGQAMPDGATALGWLYVSEGSALGAALLRKAAASLGLSDAHGARHLAPAPEGPAPHWRRFTAALNAVPITAAEEQRAIAGANAAFAHVQALVRAEFASA